MKLTFINQQTNDEMSVEIDSETFIRDLLKQIYILPSDIKQKFNLSDTIQELQNPIYYNKSRNAIHPTAVLEQKYNPVEVFAIKNEQSNQSVFESLKNHKLVKKNLMIKEYLLNLISGVKNYDYSKQLTCSWYQCIDCKLKLCKECYKQHETHTCMLSAPLTFGCKCQTIKTDVKIQLSDIIDIFKVQQIVAIVVDYCVNHKRVNSEDNVDIVDILSNNLVLATITAHIFLNSKSLSINDILQTIGNPLLLASDSFLHTILYSKADFKFFFNEIVMLCKQARIQMVHLLNEQLNYLFSKSYDDDDNQHIISFLRMVMTFRDPEVIQECSKLRLSQKLCQNIKKHQNLDKEYLDYYKDLLCICLNVIYQFKNKNSFIFFVNNEPSAFTDIAETLLVLADENLLYLNLNYEETQEFENKISVGLMYYQCIVLLFYQWYVKGINKIQNDDQVEIVLKLIKHVVQWCIHCDKIPKFVMKAGFYTDGQFFVPSIIYRVLQNPVLSRKIQYNDIFIQRPTINEYRRILSPSIMYLMQYCMVINGQVSAMNKIDWDDFCISSFESAESNIIIFEQFMCLRYFQQQNPEIVKELIFAQIAILKPNQSSVFDFFYLLSYTPQLDRSEEFFGKLLHVINKIKPSAHKINTSILSIFFPIHLCYKSLQQSITTKYIKPSQSDDYFMKTFDNFEPALDIIQIESTLERISEQLKTTFLPKCVLQQNDTALKVLTEFKDYIVIISKAIIDEYNNEIKPYSKALAALRVLKQLNIPINQQSFRHSVLNVFLSQQTDNTVQVHKQINVKDRLRALKRDQNTHLAFNSVNTESVESIDQKNESICTICHGELDETAVLPLTVKNCQVNPDLEICLDFCTHLMHSKCCAQLKYDICSVCRFKYNEVCFFNDLTKLRLIGQNIYLNLKLFIMSVDKQFSQQLVQRKIEQIQYLLKVLNIDQSLDELKEIEPLNFLKFPDSTFQLFQMSQKANCAHCNENAECGNKNECILMCLACQQFYHTRCYADGICCCCCCGSKIMLHLNAMVVTVNQFVIRAPYVNEFGQHMHSMFSDQQYLCQKRLAQCIHDIIFHVSNDYQLTKGQVYQLKEDVEYMPGSGDSSQYADDEFYEQLFQEEEQEEEYSENDYY
ncbi:Conserved_hypothetical protein [Hexamita inflata]|uniref:Phorbol-ester/DAG-type domain-containing protein n=1 Tax=Hexamita inflata TaxID=28002 RepID=A0AA86U0Y8_9EUKA|nr:Conserved hypothetical protein [Hexamita inflata]